MITRADAIRIRKAITQAASGLDDVAASNAAELFPRLKGDGSLVSAGTRINWNGAIKRAAADLWDTPENSPDNAPALWEDLAYREGYRIIPETITAGTAFAMDELGWWGDNLYKSLRDNNVWNPEQFAAGWEKIN